MRDELNIMTIRSIAIGNCRISDADGVQVNTILESDVVGFPIGEIEELEEFPDSLLCSMIRALVKKMPPYTGESKVIPIPNIGTIDPCGWEFDNPLDVDTAKKLVEEINNVIARRDKSVKWVWAIAKYVAAFYLVKHIVIPYMAVYDARGAFLLSIGWIGITEEIKNLVNSIIGWIEKSSELPNPLESFQIRALVKSVNRRKIYNIFFKVKPQSGLSKFRRNLEDILEHIGWDEYKGYTSVAAIIKNNNMFISIRDALIALYCGGGGVIGKIVPLNEILRKIRLLEPIELELGEPV